MKKSTAFTKMIITICFGFLGVHKFMERKTGIGFLYLFTLGLFFFGWFYDSIAAILCYIKISRQYALLDQGVNSSIQYKNNDPSSHKILNSSALNTYDFDCMDGHDFEHFCASLLTKNGYEDVEVTKGSGDQGIDIIAYKDGLKYGIQCKCYSSDIGNKAVQEAFSGKTYYNCHVAAVLTNRYFTKSAKDLASSNGVLLWDRDKLESLTIDS